MSYRSETVHTAINGAQVTVKHLAGFDEVHVFVGGDKFEVFRGNPGDPGTDPDRWYTEIGHEVEGPWDTADAVIAQVFLTDSF